MSTTYVVKKCKKFGFSSSLEEIRKNIENPILLESFEFNPEEFPEIENHFDFVIDLQSELFADIHIIVPKDAKIETNKEHVKDENELRNLASGNSIQLEAFSTNNFVVVYGKKSASVPQVCPKQNHEVIDYLAMNGVICSPNTNKTLSFQKMIDFLKNFPDFSIYGVHSELDNTKFIEFETPTHNSFPAYNITKGEIIAIFYRYIVKNFFAYCQVIDAATNRELDYEF